MLVDHKIPVVKTTDDLILGVGPIRIATTISEDEYEFIPDLKQSMAEELTHEILKNFKFKVEQRQHFYILSYTTSIIKNEERSKLNDEINKATVKNNKLLNIIAQKDLEIYKLKQPWYTKIYHKIFK